MLHQPSSTFEPSVPTSTAQPFDAKRYIARAYELGLMIFPTISSSGRRMTGICAYPGYDYSDGHERLAREFADERKASPDGKSAVFDALCVDFGLDPTDPAFGDKVNAICHARSRARNEGDKRLIELCKRARAALERDLAATNLRSELSDKLMGMEPKRPTIETSDGTTHTERRSAAEMREELPSIRAINSKGVVDAYRQRIATVVAYEKERARVKREIGLTRAEAAADRAGDRTRAVVENVAWLPATTLLGLAHKAAILTAWDRAGYNLSDQLGEFLALSIADDARMLGTGGNIRRQRGSSTRSPSAQVH